MAKPTITRRAMLGAITAAPIAGTILTTPAVAAPGFGEFKARLVEYYRRKAAQEAFYARYNRPANDASYALKKGTDAWQAAFKRVGELEERFGDYVESTWEALDELLLTPAPDLKALTTKLEVMLKEDEFTSGRDRTDVGEALLADARRLLDREA